MRDVTVDLRGTFYLCWYWILFGVHDVIKASSFRIGMIIVQSGEKQLEAKN